MEKFDEWFKESGLNNSYRSISLDAWNAAISACSDMAIHHYDDRCGVLIDSDKHLPSLYCEQ